MTRQVQKSYIRSAGDRGDVAKLDRTTVGKTGIMHWEGQPSLNQSYQELMPQWSGSSKRRPRFLLQDRGRAFLLRPIGGIGLGAVPSVQIQR